jgi:hypothetical protein
VQRQDSPPQERGTSHCSSNETVARRPDKNPASKSTDRLKSPHQVDPILAGIAGNDKHESKALERPPVSSPSLQTPTQAPTKDALKNWKDLNDGQIYKTHSNGNTLYLQSADDYLKRVGDFTSCRFHRAVSPGLSWMGLCWERNPKDGSTYESPATITTFSDKRIEGSTAHGPNFILIPFENMAASPTQNTPINENPAPILSPSKTDPMPEKLEAPHPAPKSQQPDLSTLTSPERQSIESACSHDKYINGPAAYNRCLGTQLGLLSTAPTRPDLSGLSSSERQSIESACSHDKYINGPAAYDRCLVNQLGLLSTSPQRPDLSGLSSSERQSIESACSHDKYINGPAAYDRCLVHQLGLLSTAPQRPDLSSLSSSERQSIESACSHDKYINGPAAYNRCLLRQLDFLKNSR